MEHLYDKLIQYAQGEDYPLHMPGHKRRLFGQMPPQAYAMDVTEIDGFDDLHAPEGILQDLQERAAKLYGARESFLLVGGSTAGILSAVFTALPEGGHLLMVRNCHKSAYHAAYLRNLQITYLMPPILAEFGICDGITPQQVKEALKADPSIQAVLLVSPTYEGRISPIREIAEVVHSYGKILIVDEAHGAHLGLVKRQGFDKGWAGEDLAEENQTEKSRAGEWTEVPNSCQAGADLVIHSVHKTLPAMTQTALLHVNGQRVELERLRRFLRIFQSSSPSYVLMASIDNALTLMEQDGEALYERLWNEFSKLTEALGACRHFRFLTTDSLRKRTPMLGDDYGPTRRMSKYGDIFSPARQDVGKLVIHAGDSGLTGQQIYDILRERYHLQLEMAAGEYCLAMFTVGDTPEGYQRLKEALLEMDQAVDDGPGKTDTDVQRPDLEKAGNCAGEGAVQEAGPGMPVALPLVAKSLREAWDAPWEEVSLDACVGRISVEFVNLYPPGTPVAAPGEVFTAQIREDLKRFEKQGLRLRGVTRSGDDLTVRCLIME